VGKSLKVRSDCLDHVKLALTRSGFARQRDLAEELDLSMSTISNYFTGRPVSVLNFIEIGKRLGLDWQDLSNKEDVSKEEDQGDHSTPLSVSLSEEPSIYVDRPPVETTCYEALLRPNALVRIKAPGLMGKTALVVNVLKQLEQQEHYRTVYLNLHFADETDFSHLNQFLRWFCVSIGQSLRLPNLLAEQWDEQFSTPKLNCIDYIERNFLPPGSGALVLCLDEVEHILSHRQVAAEFLGLLRGWHEQAKTRENWRRLRLVIVHSTEAYIPLNINESPFNVGLQIDLPEFTFEQIQDMSQLYGLNLTEHHVNQLIDMVGGHPYLVEQLLSHLKHDASTTLDSLLRTTTLKSGIFGNHLRHLWCMLEKHPALMKALADVIHSEQLAYQLFSMGVVRFVLNNHVVSRCKLYQIYFREQIDSHQPDSE
jgi:transcriptional regulator with XRE-family HTH domain